MQRQRDVHRREVAVQRSQVMRFARMPAGGSVQQDNEMAPAQYEARGPPERCKRPVPRGEAAYERRLLQDAKTRCREARYQCMKASARERQNVAGERW